MMTRTGLDQVIGRDFVDWRGQSVGIVCNQASISAGADHVLDLVLPHHRTGSLRVQAVFGPEHGLYGHTQDNMIEWEGLPDARTGFVIHSLYGSEREPNDVMLEGVERLVIDLPDVGARYYTFIWTMALCMKACAKRGIPVTVLDRPNPINGTTVEGTVLDQAFDSFVGLYPLPTRHGLTIAEVATYLHATQFKTLDLEIVAMDGWNRSMYWEETRQPWGMPSPNMPTVDTAVVYPGGCLLEACNLSEGRGTTRPFEIVGAPYLDGWKFAEALQACNLPGVKFRPIQFEPTFNKHARELCEGVFIHVVDRSTFEPVLTTIAMLIEARKQAPNEFAWRDGPYEYEYVKRPIDILAGNDWLAPAIDSEDSLNTIRARMRDECHAFEPIRRSALLY